LDLDGKLVTLLTRAEEHVRHLELAGDLVPSIEWIFYAFVRKEVVLSAQLFAVLQETAGTMPWAGFRLDKRW